MVPADWCFWTAVYPSRRGTRRQRECDPQEGRARWRLALRTCVERQVVLGGSAGGGGGLAHGGGSRIHPLRQVAGLLQGRVPPGSTGIKPPPPGRHPATIRSTIPLGMWSRRGVIHCPVTCPSAVDSGRPTCQRSPPQTATIDSAEPATTTDTPVVGPPTIDGRHGPRGGGPSAAAGWPTTATGCVRAVLDCVPLQECRRTARRAAR